MLLKILTYIKDNYSTNLKLIQLSIYLKLIQEIYVIVLVQTCWCVYQDIVGNQRHMRANHTG
jgi:hypothetical protein